MATKRLTEAEALARHIEQYGCDGQTSEIVKTLRAYDSGVRKLISILSGDAETAIVLTPGEQNAVGRIRRALHHRRS